jgi:hypothetical protein
MKVFILTAIQGRSTDILGVYNTEEAAQLPEVKELEWKRNEYGDMVALEKLGTGDGLIIPAEYHVRAYDVLK